MVRRAIFLMSGQTYCAGKTSIMSWNAIETKYMQCRHMTEKNFSFCEEIVYILNILFTLQNHTTTHGKKVLMEAAMV